MWSILSAVAGPFCAVLSRWAAPLLAGLAGWKAGKAQAEAVQIEAIAERLLRQDDAAAKAPRGRAEIIRALEKGEG